MKPEPKRIAIRYLRAAWHHIEAQYRHEPVLQQVDRVRPLAEELRKRGEATK